MVVRKVKPVFSPYCVHNNNSSSLNYIYTNKNNKNDSTFAEFLQKALDNLRNS